MTTDDSIRAMQRTIHALEGTINSARSNMRAAAEKKRKYEQRLSEVQSVNSRLHGALSEDSANCQAAQRSFANRLDAATAGYGREPWLLDSLSGCAEARIESDSEGSEIDGYIRLEINRCRREIDTAAAAYSSASADERQALSSRSYYVGRARDLASSPDATVQVWESTRY